MATTDRVNPVTTRTEAQLRVWMAISAFLYFSSGLVFLLLPRLLLQALDFLARFFRLATVLPGAMPAERFWNLLAFSMAMTIGTASALAVSDPSTRKDFCIPVIVAKLASWSSALIYFAVISRTFAHLVIFLVDFPLFLLTVFFYRRAKRERQQRP